jgi:hypothetical protein
VRSERRKTDGAGTPPMIESLLYLADRFWQIPAESENWKKRKTKKKKL